MRRAKAISEPAMASASTTATSFDEWTAIAWMASSTRMSLPAFSAELGGRLARRVARHVQHLAMRQPPGLDLLEGDVERHHLGERGGMAAPVGVLRVKDLAGIGVDDDAGIARIADGARLGMRQGRNVEAGCGAGAAGLAGRQQKDAQTKKNACAQIMPPAAMRRVRDSSQPNAQA